MLLGICSRVPGSIRANRSRSVGAPVSQIISSTATEKRLPNAAKVSPAWVVYSQIFSSGAVGVGVGVMTAVGGSVAAGKVAAGRLVGGTAVECGVGFLGRGLAGAQLWISNATNSHKWRCLRVIVGACDSGRE